MTLPALWKHQEEGVRRALSLGYQGFFYEPGTGKTRTSIECMRHWYNQEKRILRTLILAPKIVAEVWKEEIPKYSKIDESRIVLYRGTPKQRERAWKEGMLRHNGNVIVVSNYEQLADTRIVNGKRANHSALLRLLLEWKPEILICDESHRLKDLKAVRTQAVVQIASPRLYPGPKHRLILTGTPVLRDPTDLFSQMLILDQGRTFGKEYWPFKLSTMVDKNAGMKGKPNYFPKWEIRPGKLEEINAKLKACTVSVKKSECLDLPPLVRERRYVEMAPDQKKAYEEMRKHFLTFIEGKAVSAELALTKALRLLQISSGYVQTEEGEAISFKATPKMSALEELLEDLTPNHKVLVWGTFRENYGQIRAVCDRLKIKYVEIHGDVPDALKQVAAKRFREEDDIRVVIGHPGSGGIGISLVAASYAIFYSRGFSFGDDTQAEARNHRGGSEIHESVTRIDLVTKGTIDEVVLSKLEMKQSVSDTLLREIAQEI